MPRNRAGEDVSGAGTVLLAISLYYRRIIYKYFQCQCFYDTLREMVIKMCIRDRKWRGRSCMYMDRLIVKGGYGEHGRSCFLIPFAQGRYYMLDCGIMDTDENPWPEVEAELLERTEYLFLSHCHKDHSGAFSRLVSRGFRGWLVAAGATVELAGICYNKVIQADPLSAWPCLLYTSRCV